MSDDDTRSRRGPEPVRRGGVRPRPTPDEVDDYTWPREALTGDQQARVAALRAARGLVPLSPDGDCNAIDLVSLARFILTGEDPFGTTAILDEVHDLSGETHLVRPVRHLGPVPPSQGRPLGGDNE